MPNKHKDALKRALVVVMIAFSAHLSCAVAQTVDMTSVETEEQRLTAVRTLISQEKSRRLGSGPDGKPKNTAAICERMLDDLLNYTGYEAIEPLAVLNFEYPIQNTDRPMRERDENLLPLDQRRMSQNAAKKLGSSLTKKIQRCTDEEAAGDERKGRVLFNGFNYLAGAPPFRVYTLPKKLNPFPASKLVYWSEYEEKTGKGRKGYSWVNLDMCEHTDGTNSQGMASLRVKNDPQGQKTAVTIYRGKLVTWDVWRGQSFAVEQIEPKYETWNNSRINCNWATYPQEPIKK